MTESLEDLRVATPSRPSSSPSPSDSSTLSFSLALLARDALTADFFTGRPVVVVVGLDADTRDERREGGGGALSGCVDLPLVRLPAACVSLTVSVVDDISGTGNAPGTSLSSRLASSSVVLLV